MKHIRCHLCTKVTPVERVSPGMEVVCNNCSTPLVVFPKGMDVQQNANCSYCGTTIGNTDISVICPACSLELHEECWKEGDGCPTFGCEQTGVLAGNIIRITDGDLADPPPYPIPTPTGNTTQSTKNTEEFGCSWVWVIVVVGYWIFRAMSGY